MVHSIRFFRTQTLLSFMQSPTCHCWCMVLLPLQSFRGFLSSFWMKHSILHMPKLVAFHLLRNWCIIMYALVTVSFTVYVVFFFAILRSVALYMLFTWVPTWKKLSFYLSNICPTKSLCPFCCFAPRRSKEQRSEYAYFFFYKSFFLHQRTFLPFFKTAFLVCLMVYMHL